MATTIEVAQFQRHYFQNAVICGYCNGDRRWCKACDWTGIEPFYEFQRNNSKMDPILAGVIYRQCRKELVNQWTIDLLTEDENA